LDKKSQKRVEPACNENDRRLTTQDSQKHRNYKPHGRIGSYWKTTEKIKGQVAITGTIIRILNRQFVYGKEEEENITKVITRI
jgi:hypothetical protein